METNVSGGFVEIFTSSTWDLKRTQTWMDDYWVPTSVKVTAAYLLILYVGSKLMKHREAFKLDTPLAAWNLGFSIFSLCGTIRLLPELIWAVSNLGYVGSYCDRAEYYTDPYTGYWGWLFVISKAPELGDSLFLVLRKRPVIFMHWYHHALTFIYAQITYSTQQAWCRWALALNLMVHSVMYFYFFLRAIKVRTPGVVAQFITTIQILQFVISCTIFGHLFYIKSTNSIPDCKCNWNVLLMGGAMYVSYLYLFAQFFYKAYIAKKPSTKTVQNSDKAA
uniref:Elongation of very long chain fatty acids protein n=1 Tax=Plectus sambesii TaxID=2011161 RepID=A0A914X1Z8_9BILA